MVYCYAEKCVIVPGSPPPEVRLRETVWPNRNFSDLSGKCFRLQERLENVGLLFGLRSRTNVDYLKFIQVPYTKQSAALGLMCDEL